jgi:hypothetical protein
MSSLFQDHAPGFAFAITAGGLANSVLCEYHHVEQSPMEHIDSAVRGNGNGWEPPSASIPIQSRVGHYFAAESTGTIARRYRCYDQKLILKEWR